MLVLDNSNTKYAIISDSHYCKYHNNDDDNNDFNNRNCYKSNLGLALGMTDFARMMLPLLYNIAKEYRLR